MIRWLKKIFLSKEDTGAFRYSDSEKTWMKIGAERERFECASLLNELAKLSESDEAYDALWNAKEKIIERGIIKKDESEKTRVHHVSGFVSPEAARDHARLEFSDGDYVVLLNKKSGLYEWAAPKDRWHIMFQKHFYEVVNP